MRYIKVFLLIIVFFLAMIFFVQNQASFEDSIVLKFDLMFVPSVESIPVPLYAIMLICFTAGGLLVLLMLLWDRVSLSARCAAAKSKASGLNKKLIKMEASLRQTMESKAKTEEKYNVDMKAVQEKHKNDMMAMQQAHQKALQQAQQQAQQAQQQAQQAQQQAQQAAKAQQAAPQK